MTNLGADSDGAQRLQTADAEQDFLLNAHAAVAAVQPGRDHAQVRLVIRYVAVEQVKFDAADLGQPDLGRKLPTPELYLNLQRIAEGIVDQRDRKLMEVVAGIAFELPAVLGQLLFEIALAVNQADTNQRNAEIRGRFEMVAGQYTQAARIDWQRLMNAEFGRKIRDHFVLAARKTFLVPGATVQINVKRVDDALQLRHVGIVVGHLLQAVLADLPQHGDRVVVDALPQLDVQPAKKLARRVVPRPPEVVGELP